MKKFLLTISACAALAPMMAHQIENSDFSGLWVECTPWTSIGNETPQGTQPEGWTISNVIGINGLGATTVGFKDLSSDSDSTAVKLVNCPNPMMATQIVPGYITLGTTWSTAQGFPPSHKDGGTFGGVEFAYTPDALAMKYKRAHAVEVNAGAPVNDEEPATVVAYLWKGTFSQAEVPGDIGIIATKKVNMIDRDRNILGMETAEGGEVTTTEGAELIAKLNYSITGDAEEWTEFLQPIEYLSDSKPEKFNLIVAANDYFGNAESVGCGNTLVIDDVKLVYYSRLASFEINGAEIPGFDSRKYEYDLVVPAGANPGAIMATMKYPVMGRSAVVIPGFDPATFTATLTVKNPEGTDIDGKSEHVYTFHIIVESQPASGKEFVGKIDIDLLGDVTTLEDQKLNITDIEGDHCTLALYHFSLGNGSDIGDIIIENVTMTETDGVIAYKGSKKGLELAGGTIVADVECEGTEDANGIVNMDINVLWDSGETIIPIKVTFTNASSSISDITVEDAPAVYYHINGVKATGITPGLYIKVQDGRASKVLVK